MGDSAVQGIDLTWENSEISSQSSESDIDLVDVNDSHILKVRTSF